MRRQRCSRQISLHPLAFNESTELVPHWIVGLKPVTESSALTERWLGQHAGVGAADLARIGALARRQHPDQPDVATEQDGHPTTKSSTPRTDSRTVMGRGSFWISLVSCV